MITSGCSISLSNERKRFQEKIALVWRVDEDTFGGIQWPTFHIRQHIQKNANRVFCAACLELVQVCHCCGCLGDMWRSRALFRMTVSCNAAQYLLPYQ